MQVVADDAHLALHDLRVEWFASAHPVGDKASIVSDALASHESCLSIPLLLDEEGSSNGQISSF